MRTIGYNVYRCAEGCDPIFLGFATTLKGARRVRKTGGLPRHLWETARAAGHCDGLSAPDTEGEDEAPAEWFGHAGDVCAVAVRR